MTLRRAVGLAALFSGTALLLNLIVRVALPVGLIGTAGVLGGVLLVRLFRSDPEARQLEWNVAKAGLLTGLVATFAYDVARWGLSLLDPSPFQPFETLKVFGALLLGDAASVSARLIAGAILHLVNGTCFGMAYAALFGRQGRRSVSSAAVTGISWGLFLETFQLTLYPDWLRIIAIREFIVISALSHVVFGANIGLLSRRLLRRWVYDPYLID